MGFTAMSRVGQQPGSLIRNGRAGLLVLGAAAALVLAGATGLQAQAYRVKDINPGSGSGVDIFGSTPSGCCIGDEVVAVGDTLYFAANDGIRGLELWRTDGTEAGTVLVKDINPGPMSSSPDDLTRVGNVVFFAADDGIHGYELWKSDGTAAGTVLVKDINPGGAHGVGYISYGARGRPRATLGNLLFFVGYDGIHGYELWRSDGTAGGTMHLHSSLGLQLSNVKDLTPFAGAVYFSALTGPSVGDGGLWKSDGTEAGTTLVKPFPGLQPFYFTELDGVLYFAANDLGDGGELWKSDGTTTGTVLVRDIYPGPAGSMSDGGSAPLQSANGRVFVSAWGGLWVSDGTEAGTSLVADVAVGGVTRFVGLAGPTFFAAYEPIHGTELWRTDGTPAGTMLLKDIEPGSSEGLDGLSMKTLRSEECALYFKADDGQNGTELWTSDGTTAGTVLLQDFTPLGGRSNAVPVLRAGNLLYLEADDGIRGRELWALDVVRDCPVLSFEATASTVAEAAGTFTVEVKVTIPSGAPTARPVSVSYVAVGGSAAAGDDYTAASGTLTFPAGSPSGTTLPMSLTVVDDPFDEEHETLLIQISNPAGGTLGASATHRVTILDDDPPPEIVIDDVSIAEGNTGTTSAVFTASLSAPSGRGVTVAYATSDGTAVAGADYAQGSATIVFPPGSAGQTIEIPVIGDRVHEGDEVFTVTLSSPLNATLADAQGQGTVLDDDPQGLSVADLTTVEPMSGSRAANFTVTLSPTSSSTVTVDYSTSGITATSGGDYDPASGTLTFDPGVSTVPLHVTIHADTLIEGVETFEVNLANASGATIAYGQAIGHIYDPGNFFTVVPCRVVDTRNPPGPFGGPALEAGQSRIVALAGACHIPTSARAVSLNVTVTQATASGNIRLYPADVALPTVSSLNYSAAQTRGNNALVGLSADGRLAIRCAQAAGTTAHVIVDVNGYFE